MALHIEDVDADRVVRELAEATGESIPVAIARAAEERLTRIRRRDPEQIVRDIDEIVERVRKLPVLDDRSPDEILGYDEHGLPT